jgi:hypothetical protein
MSTFGNIIVVGGSISAALLACVGIIVCYLNMRLSRHLWLVILGFLIWSGLNAWDAMFVLLVRHLPQSSISLVVGIGCLLQIGALMGWCAVICGLTFMFRDVRTRLENYESAWRLIEEQEPSAEERTQRG